jgi:asparagine synthase (glutamine-hydrolysing)
MSAIFGLLHLDGRPVEQSVLDRMSARLSHRGPDGGGVWAHGTVGVGHRLLHTTPESLCERQPCVLASPPLALVADARLDERDELIAALGLERGRARRMSDPDLLLAAYAKWGERCLERLVGDFAFAVWDARSQTLFCARDPFGVRPLYYHRSGRLFAFASEIKALLCHEGVPRRLNELQVACHLESIVSDPEITFYEGIVRLPGGTSLTVSRDRTTGPVRYVGLDAVPEVRLRNDAEYADAFHALFTEAVRCRTRSAFPVGSTLSGGLDSSSIACTARAVHPSTASEPVRTFSAVFPGLPEPERQIVDESRYIDAVVATGGFQPHLVHADQHTPLEALDDVLWHLDEAPLAYNLYMHRALYGAAQRSGSRVFLDGIDGDFTVGYGYERLAAFARAERWDSFEQEVRALSAVNEAHGLRPRHFVQDFALPYCDELARGGRWLTWARTTRELTRRFGTSRRRLLIHHGLRPLATAVLSPAAPRVRRNNGFSVVDPGFARRVGLAARPRLEGADASADDRGTGKTRWPDLSGYQYVLEIADRTASAFSLEPRYPFFDRRLFEFCLGLPPEQRLSGGWTRIILRRAMEGVLPPEIQWRPMKQNLGPNFDRGLRTGDRRMLDAAVHRSDALIGEYCDLPGLRARYQRLFREPGQARPEDGLILYRVAVLARWLGGGGDWEVPTVRTPQSSSLP